MRTALAILIAATAAPAYADDGAMAQPIRDAESQIVTYELPGGATGYKAGEVLTDTPLPESYPAPTPPGAIEIKRYPAVRRAEVEGPGRDEDGMFGLNGYRAFRPLFNHIKDRGIAMTAPVEMEYSDDSWTMAFLYREQDLGPTGEDGVVRVYDSSEFTVISMGVMGDLSDRETDDIETELARIIDADPLWRVAGHVRKLTYNGPNIRESKRWHEIQLPIAPTEPAEED